MKIVDANVLLNAVNAQAVDHEVAREWLDQSLSRRVGIGLAWPVLVAFLRVSTRANIFPRPMSTAESLTQFGAWLDAPSVSLVNPTPMHGQVLSGLLSPLNRIGNLADDAHLAALAIEHRAEVVTFDSDFARFPGVRWERPS